MKFQETSAKTATNIEETVEDMVKSIVKEGLMEVKKEKKDKIALADQDRCRKQENDSCC